MKRMRIHPSSLPVNHAHRAEMDSSTADILRLPNWIVQLLLGGEQERALLGVPDTFIARAKPGSVERRPEAGGQRPGDGRVAVSRSACYARIHSKRIANEPVGRAGLAWWLLCLTNAGRATHASEAAARRR